MTSESSCDSPARSGQHDPDSSRNGEPQQESSRNYGTQTLTIPPEVRARQKFGKPFRLSKQPDAKRRRLSNASFSGNTRGEVDVTPESATATEVENLHHPATHSLPPGCEDILFSNIFAHNGDEESKNIIAAFLALEILVLEGMKPLTSYDEVMAMLTGWETEIKTKIEQLRASQAYGVMDDATRPNKRNSWKEDPKEVLCLVQERLRRIPSTKL